MRIHSFLFILVLLLSTGTAPAQQPLEFVLQSGHTREVASLGLSADGKYLLTASGESPAILWEVSTGKILRTFTGSFLTMSRDGRFLLAAEAETAILWETVTGKKIQTLKLPTGDFNAEIRCAAVSLDGKRLFIGHWDWFRTVDVWDTTTGKKIQPLKGGVELMSGLAVSDDGKRAISTSRHAAAVWDTEIGNVLRYMQMLPEQPRVERRFDIEPKIERPKKPDLAKLPQRDELQVAPAVPAPHDFVWGLSSDGARLLLGSTDGAASVSPLAAGKPGQSFKSHDGMIRCIAESADGKLVVTGASGNRAALDAPADNTAILWDAANGKKLKTFDLGDTGGVWSVTLSRDAKQLVTGSLRQAMLWDAASGKKTRSFEGSVTGLEQMVASRDGKRIVTTLSDAKATILWDSTGPRKIDVGSNPSYPGLALNGDGKFLLNMSAGKATLWDTATSKKLQTFAEGPMDLALCDDGKIVVTHSPDGTSTHIWDAVTGKKTQSIKQDSAGFAPGYLTRAAYTIPFSLSADGKFIVTGSSDGKTANQWDAGTGKKLMTFNLFDKEVRGVAVSRDGKRVLTRTNLFDSTTMIVWDAATGKRVVTFDAPPVSTFWNGTVSRDAKNVLTGDLHGQSVTVWEADSGKKVQTLHGHAGQIMDVALTADGNLWTASQDGAIRLWNSTGKELCRLYSFDAGKDWLVVTPDGLFDGSPGATRFVAYREPATLKLIEDEATLKRYHRPGLLAQVWNGKGAWSAPLDDLKSGRGYLADDGQIGTIRRLIVSADGATMVTDGTDQIIRCWDAKTGKLLQRFEGISDLYGQLLSLSPDGKCFLTSPHIEPLRPILDDGLILWDVATAKQIRRFQLTASDDDIKRGGRKGSPIDGVFSPDGKTLAIASEYNLHYHFFDLASAKELRRVCWCPGGGLSSSPSPCRWSPDGKHFAGRYAKQSVDFVVALWDMTKTEPQILSEVGEHVYDMAFSADGDYFAWSDMKQVHLWDVRANRKIKTFEGMGYLAFSPDGQYLAAGKTLHPLSAKAPGLQLPVEPGWPTCFRDSQTLIVVSPDKNVLVFDIRKLEKVR